MVEFAVNLKLECRRAAQCDAVVGRVARAAAAVCAVWCFAASPAWTQHPDLRGAARQLRRHVVTVRVETRAGGVVDASSQRAIVVCSGVIVSKRFVVAPVFGGSDSKVRLTLPHGLQARGTIRVVDEYSGLALVRIDRDVQSGLVLADRLPEVGAWVLSAAGWGNDEPVVSLGIVAATGRRVGGIDSPPLLQVDLRATATSSGAGVVDEKGRLIGIVALIDKERGGGWSYAVPVEHVRRILRAADAARSTDSLIVLKRRRPTVGMVLEADGDRVVVARVTPGGPAAQAGISVGDQIVAVGGHHIRSVYQAIRPVLARQPGDRLEWKLLRNDSSFTRTLVLGGGVELPPTRLADLSQFVQPRIAVGQPPSEIAAQRPRRPASEVAVEIPEKDSQDVRAARDRQRVALLEKALQRYLRTLELLQEKLETQETERAALQRELDVVKQELSELRAGTRRAAEKEKDR